MKTFEFKSSICTSVEQSKRLLELGLKKETADMCWRTHYLDKYFVTAWDILQQSDDIPAWSLHRLIEILPKELELDGKRLEFIITYSMDVMLLNERNEEYLTFFANNLYESIILYIEWLNAKNLW